MRKQAREDVFKLIYESFFDKSTELSEDNIKQEMNENDKAFVESLLSLYLNNKQNIFSTIEKYIVGYELNRLYKIDLALLCLAVTEIYYYKETPTEVVVNETIELAKKFSTDKSPSFLNGVISSIIKGEA